jgi:hypothetical protein
MTVGLTSCELRRTNANRLFRNPRLILKEMSLAGRDLHAVSGHSSLEFKLKPLVAEVHALRTLAETVRYESELTVETDIVDLDGPKFKYVLSEITTVFKESRVRPRDIKPDLQGFP